MILKLKIKSNSKTKKAQLFVWIEKTKELQDDIEQLIMFFKDQIQVKKRLRLHVYYKITSDNPAIMLSFHSTIQELIPDIYFKEDDLIGFSDN